MAIAPASLGVIGLAREKAGDLEPVTNSVDSYLFVSQVGGIAFGGKASPAGRWAVKQLRWDESQPDGKRLQVTLARRSKVRTVTAPIHDWVLFPTARFADGDRIAVFTLFGQLQDEARHQAVTKAGKRVVNYHRAFRDTLLGLRLMQADILLLHPDATELPRDAQGRTILGPGEAAPSVEVNRGRLASVHSFIGTLPGRRFRSYVITDQGVRVTYGIDGERLKLTGYPRWHCWRDKVSDRNQVQLVVQKAQAAARDRLQAEYERDRRTLSPVEFNQRWRPELQKRKLIGWLDEILTKQLYEPMPVWTKRLSEKILTEQGINPAVYNAVTATLRYSAFFRHVKSTSPEVWDAFFKSVGAMRIKQAVLSPSVVAM